MPRWPRAGSICLAAVAGLMSAPTFVHAQQSSTSAWDAADFRIWGYIPYWTSGSEITSFQTSGLYSHVSDVLYFGGYRPDASGNIAPASSSYVNTLATLRTQAVNNSFKLHLSMFETTGDSTFPEIDATWEALIANPTARANFVAQLKTLMQGGAGTADDLKGFNFDWERPSNATEWGNYTQLARQLRTAINPLGMEISVCDYGSTDTTWDNTSLFDAKVYDQLFIMSYHLSTSSTSTYADQKLALTQQGAAKAFSDDQLAIGFGTWGDNGPATVGLDQIVATGANIAYNQGTFTGTVGSSTGTWTIESRERIRAKAQLAITRNMPGMFSWTMHFDAQNVMGLHRVAQHYAMVKRDIPDLNLDGDISAADANALANNMGTNTTNTGATTPAQFDAFYLNGNWEKGDRDGNGFINQADADWLAGRYAALGVNLPDRLAYSGTFESFNNSTGLNGRWRAARNGQNKLIETGNFKQEITNHLAWSGTGAGASQRSNNFVTIRNQNATEVSAGVNSAMRSMQADLSQSFDTAQQQNLYFTFLVRENANQLTATQLASGNRTLSLEFLNGVGTDQFDFVIKGLTGQIGILSEADATGQDATLGGLSTNTTYLFVGKVAGNGAGANTMQASFFASGATVGDFTNPDFNWMLTATGSLGYNPLITGLQFASFADSNFTISNLWLSTAAVPEPTSGLALLVGGAFLMHRRRTRRQSWSSPLRS
ncbi:MAG: glycosyl hydrolase family 18 protein [Tepidisphaeraceae bacterium]